MRLPLRILSVLLLALPMAAAAAGPAYLVKDLKTGLDPFDPAYPSPSFFGYAAAGGRVVFFGLLPEGIFSGTPQCGLWSTDGTAAGTLRIADLCDRDEELVHQRFQMLGSNGAVAFFAGPQDRLWRTDGTAAGTFPLGTVRVDFLGIVIPAVGPGGILVFGGCTQARGCEPWSSDGTPRGTRLLRDARPGGDSSYPAGFIRDGGRVLFVAEGGLWSTDGTPAGTVLLTRVPHFQDYSFSGSPVRQGSRIYFMLQFRTVDAWVYDEASAKATRLRSFPTDYRYHLGATFEKAAGRVFIREFDTDNGRAVLWETDGTRQGTRPTGPPFELADLSRVREVGGKAVFSAFRQGALVARLWTLAPGSKRPSLLTGCPGGCPTEGGELSPAIAFGGRLYFVGKDAAHGYELWSTDGTGPGTRLVKDLCPGVCDGFPAQFRAVGDRLLFVDAQARLWASDGTPGGTVILGTTVSYGSPDNLLDGAPLGSGIVFSGFDATGGYQPWKSDLTPDGTAMIAALGGTLAASGWPSGMTALGNRVLFQACDDATGGLWSSDGNEAGTFQLPGSDVPCTGGRPLSPFVPLGDAAFYAWNGKLWRTDGTESGTVELADLPTLRPLFLSAAPLGSKLLLIVDPPSFPPPTGGWEWTFWTSDGTPGGTREAFPFRFGGSPGPIHGIGGLVYFIAQAAATPYVTSLWRTDGTEAGTFALLSHTGGGGFDLPMFSLGGRTIFLLGQRAVGPELWSTDGTVAGTTPVVPITTGRRPRNPSPPVLFRDALYFFARNNENPAELDLWRSDGTAAGTQIVKSLAPWSPEPGFDTELTAAGDLLFFRAEDGVHGLELWKSDGTAAGTAMMADINPGPAGSRLDGLTAGGGRVWFGAEDGEHGFEPWVSDGTAAGTHLVQDILPGPAPSNPGGFAAAGGLLYFNANDGEHGRELWAVGLATPWSGR